MPDLTKYDVLLNELFSIESQLSAYKEKTKGVHEKNGVLEKKLAELTRENRELKQKIDDLHQIIQSRDEDAGSLFGTVNSREKEALKTKIQNLISRIDYHLSS